jgi:uncharacterized protein (TIGR03085 family)
VHEVVNHVEMAVHHEDLRRARAGWEPRDLEPAQQQALWGSLRTMGRLMYRRAEVGVRLRTPDGEEVEARPGEVTVTLTGEPLELILHAFGRGAQARVRADGPPDAVAALGDALLGV